jgi:hypothetical protein
MHSIILVIIVIQIKKKKHKNCIAARYVFASCTK